MPGGAQPWPAAPAGADPEALIYRVVQQVPAGQVATYGQIALVAGAPSARLVGRALARLPAGRRDVPWHRVINSQGRISPRAEGDGTAEQARRLRAEGVLLDAKGRVDFAAVAWTGPSWAWLARNGFDLEELVLRSRARRRTGAWCRWTL